MMLSSSKSLLRHRSDDIDSMKSSYSDSPIYKSGDSSMMTRWPGKKKKRNTMLYIVAFVLFFGVLLTCINVYELRRLQLDHMSLHTAPEAETYGGGVSKKPIVWINGKNPHSGYLKHVFAVFERLGYQTVTSPVPNWDILWMHDYPFISLREEMLNLKPHQRVNHFPGTGFVTNKAFLAASTDISHIPKAFKVPKQKDEFLEYAKAHPNKKWVQKGSNHRGIKIRKLDELDFSSEDTFIQEYIDNPYLIDGRRFDIGVYTVVSSINPLRIYVNNGDWLIRFCPTEYYPFDQYDLTKYVINDDYLPVWQLPSLQKIYSQLNYPFKETVLTHLRSEGHDVDALLADIFQTIREVYLSKEIMFIHAASRYKSSRNFFEMVRFDFILDKDMKLYLLEVNMSPNLSTGHFSQNKLLYEETLYGMLTLVGVGRTVHNDISRSATDETNMQVSERDINVFSDNCQSDICEENCLKTECKLCGECLTVDNKYILKRAYLEHHNKKNWKRVMPLQFQNQSYARSWLPKRDKFYTKLSQKNQWMMSWFRGKCLQDESWC